MKKSQEERLENRILNIINKDLKLNLYLLPCPVEDIFSLCTNSSKFSPPRL